ncbi:MAG: ArsR/SmtB family transcription factor [Desulfurivibrionaceae bacterium]|jgi:ArsR family transcriptional regulator|nr:metalloregulator ArsR/SmtB family transcription factor [Pseudomonadota bacterium]MCG2823430.1 metalloregulator ArsR/SmtB family transcription factor [Desulfobulbaceae bacterium]MDP2002877.1 metalloregulator ArsR/SmtB family transcription factor [Desulfurivibrionaceae bacterium]PKN15753.1 MAG: transcriptional regulator [Deltaproteobacteria bacterium HGW-Deltaproteobacteria-3]MBU4229844.1 metalloregulator ArsR/SmtB family transcription factor [Pseudomonadota bacterium]
MKEFVRLMKALSDQNRVKIITMLGVRELCVCELTALLGVAQPTVSKHLRILEDAGLVSFRKEGNWIIYRLNDECPDQGRTMLGLVDQWLDTAPEIEGLRRRVPEVRHLRKIIA